MRCKRPEDLQAQLARGLAPVYLLTGDEPLLVQEAADAVRGAARDAGIEEREIFHVESGFDWQALLQSAGSMSLFSSRRLLELRMRSAAPGKEGGEALRSWVAQASGDDVLLVLMPKLDARSQKAKWYTTLEGAGVHLPLWPVALDEMPRWLAQRCRSAGLRLDEEAMALLTSRVEGNLLAASQALTRLSLAAQGEVWTAEALKLELDDDARYTPFELADRMLAADAVHAHRILSTLRAEGTEPLALVAVLARELRTLRALKQEVDSGAGLDAALRSARVFPRRQPLLRRALGRLSLPLLEGCLRDLALVDQAVKGLSPIDPWDELDRLVLRIAGVRTTPLALKARSWLGAG